MFNRSLLLCASAVAAVLLFAPAAHADEVFTLDNSTCSSGCNVLPAGTVTLSSVTGGIEVTVNLVPDYSFRTSNDTHHFSLAFDLSGVSGVGVSGISSGPTSQTFSFLGAGSYAASGLGTFNYAIDCTSCATGATGTPTQTLSFLLTGTNLSLASFGTTSIGNYFGADVVGLTSAAGVGGTGNIGTKAFVTLAPTPEPSSLAMIGTGVFALAGIVRRKYIL